MVQSLRLKSARSYPSCVIITETDFFPLGQSWSGSVIQDHSHHGCIKGTYDSTMVTDSLVSLMYPACMMYSNDLYSRHWTDVLKWWCTQMILDHRSWSRSQMCWTENPKNRHKSQNHRLKRRMPANHTRHQNRKNTVLKCENRKTNQKSANSKTSAEGYHLHGDGYTDRVVSLDSK